MATKRGNIVRIRPAATESRTGVAADFGLFRGLTDAEFRRATSMVEEKRYFPGEAIFRRNDPGDYLYEVREGIVKLVARSKSKGGTILSILRSGDLFGELLFAEEKRLFTAVAVTDAAVSAISRKNLSDLFSRMPAVRLNFIRHLSGRLARVEKGVSDFSHTWSYHRLAMILQRLCVEYGEEAPEGVRIRLPLTHAELAEMIGATRETVTNQMTRFKKMGLLTARGRRLVVDRGRLSEFLRSEEANANEGRREIDESA